MSSNLEKLKSRHPEFVVVRNPGETPQEIASINRLARSVEVGVNSGKVLNRLEALDYHLRTRRVES